MIAAVHHVTSSSGLKKISGHLIFVEQRVHTCMHTYVHTYIHNTYIRTYIHTHAQRNTNTGTNMQTYILMHGCTHARLIELS